ncbi:hypothetical protein D9758_007747 [Tetrapyrgos nigripes]|uniref:Uncharacterized protein n=1 Tax=Tetrapyrgos nigripes TaxID=182062 RepID=A0A8H5LID1_9AGAR|nr:hypothetical protein D9758_007747 [Tetrapyrgos nigripes]
MSPPASLLDADNIPQFNLAADLGFRSQCTPPSLPPPPTLPTTEMLSKRTLQSLALTLLRRTHYPVAVTSGHLHTTNKIALASRAMSSQASGAQQPTPSPNATTNAATHTSDSYSKDVDANPPNDPTIHRVDPDSETSQKSYEPPKGKYSEAGVRSAWENGWKDKEKKE